MTINLILLLLVASYEPLSSLSTLVHGIIDGSMSESWSLNLTIDVRKLDGIMLYCIDSAGGQFGVEVKQTSPKTIRINFNKAFKELYLRDLCGCDPCNETTLIFVAEHKSENIEISCNNCKPEYFSVIHNVDEHDITLYPIPEAIYKSKRKVFVMMGNIGPYVGENNVVIYPMMYPMVGCVRAFYYGDGPLTLNGSGTEMQSTCPNSCHGNICNGGVCRQRSFNSATCDCSTTALNGPYCDRGLTMYVRGGNNSYEKRKDATEMHVKMTWKTLLYKKYCLLEIVLTHARVTISIYKNHLMMASSIISDVSADGLNFVSVNATNNNLIVKSRNDVSKVDFGLSEGTRLHIGFSESDLSCVTFDGAYDLLLDWSQWRQTGPSSTIRAHSVGYSTVSTVVYNKQTSSTSRNIMNTWIMNPVSGIASFVIVIIIVTLVGFIKVALLIRLKRNAMMEKIYEDLYEQVNVYNIGSATSDRASYTSMHFAPMHDPRISVDGEVDGYLSLK